MPEKSKIPIYGEAVGKTIVAWLFFWSFLCVVLKVAFPLLDTYPPPTPEEKRIGYVIVGTAFLYSLTVAYRYFRQQLCELLEQDRLKARSMK